MNDAGANFKRFDSSATMFVYLRGHHLIEYYFSIADARLASNDRGNDGGASG